MYSVLLVTADGDLREAGARVLGTAGFAVTTAAHGGHALLACLSAARFDVLVIEDEDRHVATRLLRRQPGMRIVRIGRHDAELVRPFFADDLIAAVSVAAAVPSPDWEPAHPHSS